MGERLEIAKQALTIDKPDPVVGALCKSWGCE